MYLYSLIYTTLRRIVPSRQRLQHPEGQIRADIRISLKRRGGRTHRIELARQPVGRRYWVRRDGKYSTKMPEATATQIAERIRRWLVANT
jgi:hypothetical protein